MTMKKSRMFKPLNAAGLAVAAIIAAAPAAADPVADFYSGRTVTVVVAAAPGGNHSLYTQLLAPHWKKLMPGNPTFIINNMGGAGGTKAANYLYNSAPQDGTYIGILLQDTPLAARIRATGVRYDPEKFHYLGGADNTRSMITALASAGVKTIEEAKTKELICGSSGKGSQTYYIPALANYFLGTKFKIVLGYQGMNPVDAAMDQGETNCRAGVYASIIAIRPHWIRDNLVVQLAAADSERHPLYPDVPSLIELAKDEDAKKVMSIFYTSGVIGRAWLAPPKVPQDRIDALRKAFWASFQLPEVKEEAKKRNFDLNPVSWEKQQETVKLIMSAPDQLFDIAKKALDVKE